MAPVSLKCMLNFKQEEIQNSTAGKDSLTIIACRVQVTRTSGAYRSINDSDKVELLQHVNL